MDLTMIKRWQWVLRRITRRLWFRASLFSLLGVATAFLGLVLKQYIPDDVSARVGADAVDNILEVLVSSMLVATTFSLNIMVSAYASATTNVTPARRRFFSRIEPLRMRWQRSSVPVQPCWHHRAQHRSLRQERASRHVRSDYRRHRVDRLYTAALDRPPRAPGTTQRDNRSSRGGGNCRAAAAHEETVSWWARAASSGAASARARGMLR